MTTRDQLLGVWNGSSMLEPSAESYDVLVFNADGTGFLDLSDAAHGFTAHFRWELEPEGLRLVGQHRSHQNPTNGTFDQQPSPLNALTTFTIHEGALRLAARPWSGASEHYLYYRRDIPIHATFQARNFVRPDE